jgi:N-sulfoglucosamine sulfohydrolase
MRLRLHPLLCLALFTVLLPLASAAPKPNVLFLLSDDHSYPFLSCYGDANVKTPTLDKLAAEGMKFHRFFTTAPQCVPSRASLMTGRSPVAARITRFSSPLPKDEIIFPQLLREQAGYYTGICGRSFHLDGSGGKGDPGIGEILTEHQMRTFEDRVDFLEGCPDAQVATQLEAFLDKKPEDKPFFMWANFSNPHHVWNAPAEFRPDPASLKLPAHWPDLPGMREQLADYCAEVNQLDQTIAGVLQVLVKRQLMEQTMIVFIGDNGVALPHGKGSLYDPGSNVPCVVRWPGHVKAGTESRALISGEDLAPTLLAAAAVAVPTKISGVSFLPLLQGESFTPRKHLFVERGPHGSAPVTLNMTNNGYDLSRAVRSDRYKFIYNCTPWIPYAPVDSSGGAAWRQITAAHEKGALSPGVNTTYFTTPRPVYELYDLETDPSELNNVSGKAELAEVEASLRRAMAEKMILDFDYLPLPALNHKGEAKATPAPKDKAGNRAGAFKKLDANGDGKLSKDEFSAGRQPEDAEKWWQLRDTDKDGFLSREEYFSEAPLTK